MGFFKLISKKNLNQLDANTQIPESDFATVTKDNELVQFEYIEDNNKPEPYNVTVGIWTIQKSARGLVLEPTDFTHDSILENFVHTKELSRCINCFFTKFDVYKKYGFPVPKRAALLYGPPGSGKSTSITKVCQEHVKDGATAVIMWATDKIDPFEVKDFFKRFNYVNINKVILVAEDIGGVEADQVRMKSTSSLLSLLDNKEKIFTIPIFIIATTNFPENFLGNITNRPGRFDDKINMGYPNDQARYELLKFFGKGEISEKVIEKVKQKKYEEFSPAHLQEVVIRSAIYDITVEESLDQVHKEIERFKKDFNEKKQSLGIKSAEYDDDDI